MREVPITGPVGEATTFAACVATILELPLDDVPVELPPGRRLVRWLGSLGLGLVPIADAASFAWAGSWIGWLVTNNERRAVVMYGSPAGVIFDPAGIGSDGTISGGFVIAAFDIALARPARVAAPTAIGTVESIWLADAAGTPARGVGEARALAGLGLDGDRHVVGTGTFPSHVPGSALTLIEAEVCEAFEPPLSADDHRRNLVTRGIALNGLVGHEIAIGSLRCRGMRLCEPCIVIERYAKRKIMRGLVHRGGLRVDILEDGVIRVGDRVRVVD